MTYEDLQKAIREAESPEAIVTICDRFEQAVTDGVSNGLNSNEALVITELITLQGERFGREAAA